MLFPSSRLIILAAVSICCACYVLAFCVMNTSVMSGSWHAVVTGAIDTIVDSNDLCDSTKLCGFGSAKNELRKQCIFAKAPEMMGKYAFDYLRNRTLFLSSASAAQCTIPESDELYKFVSPILTKVKNTGNSDKASIFQQIKEFERLQVSNRAIKWEELSSDVKDAFTLNNSIEHRPRFYNHDVQNNATEFYLNWSEAFINHHIEVMKNFEKTKQCGICSYGPGELRFLMKGIEKYIYPFISGSSSIVVGSQSPWIEIALLAKGNASVVTTAEYGLIEMGHPKMRYIHPSQFDESFVSRYDFGATFSSLEHAGLGRYGDPINPLGDIMVMLQLSCMIKPGGLLFFGGPVADDCIEWNACYFYGPRRLRMMFQNWKLIDVFHEELLNFDVPCAHNNQLWFVLQNKRGCL